MTDETSTSIHIPQLYYPSLFQALPGSCILLQNNAPHYTVLAATPEYLAQTGYRKEAIIGKGVFEMSPANPNDPADTGASDLNNSLDHVRLHKEPHELPVQRYDIAGENGRFSERFWRASNKPVVSDTGEVAYIIHSADDITLQVKAREREVQIEGIEKVFGLFMHAPMVVGLVDGENNVLKMANEEAFKLWGKSSEIIGKPILEGLPELKGQGIIELFERVRTSGQPYIAHEVPVSSVNNGKEEQHYFNLVYQPYYNKNSSKATGVFTISHDVTEQVRARLKAQESEEKYRTLFESMDQGYCTLEIIFDGEQCVDYRYLETNPSFERHLGMTNALGKTIREIAPDIEPKWFDFYGGVALTGNPIRIEEESKAFNKWFEVYAIRLGGAEERKVGVFFIDVTGRKKAEEAISQSENNLRNTILQAPVAMAILRGSSFVVEIANDRMFELWGRRREELLGEPLFERLPEVKYQGYEEILKTVFTTGERFVAQDLPVNVPRKSGIETVFIGLLLEAFREANGAITGVIVVAMDVTEQVQARRKIEGSEIRFRTMADASPVMIWTLDAEGNSTYYNKTATDFTGHTEQELKEGKSWQTAIHPDDIAFAGGVVNKAVQNLQSFQMECRMRRADGDWRWLLSHGTPRLNKNNQFLGYVGSSVDITDLKKSQQELQTALEQIRLSKEAAELGTFDMDLENGTMHWDDRCRILFGIIHHEPVTYEGDFVKGLHPEDRVRIVKVIDKAFVKSVSNGDYDVEYRTIGVGDGIVRWIRAKGKVYFDAHEKPVRFIGSVLDITEQVTLIQRIERLVEERTKELGQANESLLQVNKELQRSNANLEEFTYAASHDLKEPIRKISIFCNQLKAQLIDRLNENESRLFSRVQNATERMTNLVNDLLLYSHVTHRPHETESIDLNQKVQNVLEDLELDIAEKSAIIEVAKLPVVKGYRRQLQQLFQNLVSNALKYSKADVPPHIVISSTEVTEHNNRYYVISIADNGIGFEQKFAEQIFHMFTRLHGKAEYSGTGVGLSIVKKVVENHNGFIRVESSPGVGSKFIVSLSAD